MLMKGFTSRVVATTVKKSLKDLNIDGTNLLMVGLLFQQVMEDGFMFLIQKEMKIQVGCIIRFDSEANNRSSNLQKNKQKLLED